MNAMKRYLVGLCCAVAGLLTQSTVANNLVVTNVSLKGGDVGYTFVQADVSWNNSWRSKWEEPIGTTNVNWDAAWVFVKYRVATNGAWQHASLSTNNNDHVVVASTAAATVNVATNVGGTNGCGLFLYRSAEGQGSWTNTLKLRWNYAQDGVASTAHVDVSVQAIEMVYVPQGNFKVGSGGTELGSFTEGNAASNWVSGTTPSVPFAITNESALTISNAAGCLWGTSTNGNTSIGSTGVLPAAYPKGYRAFYCMKYEYSQGQWVGFFNMLTDSQKSTNDITGGTYNSTGKGTDLETNRNTIAWTSGDATCATPDRACNFLSLADATAYADWAGLRPMTELEFEKACRGSANPVANEYPWGNSATLTQLTGETDAGSGTSTVSTVVGANCCYGNYAIMQGPTRCGIFATASSGRVQAGATYWGIMEMGGNLTERPVMVADVGRTFTGALGDGKLADNGNANVPDWPSKTALTAGYRGGAWYLNSNYPRISDRQLASNTATDSRNAGNGFRAVRQAP